ncbi:hypothetical protein Vadar_013557 [Vaccinium darrowii]|uniref:Uncharacterized protein n=1 Tax=Vaccinium darrowii TaxID=229202 RepID=A0ACB7YD96_9ERIC|nr:hypothetical protein Vadar_013557 [Vaccinium darrowii]
MHLLRRHCSCFQLLDLVFSAIYDVFVIQFEEACDAEDAIRGRDGYDFVGRLLVCPALLHIFSPLELVFLFDCYGLMVYGLSGAEELGDQLAVFCVGGVLQMLLQVLDMVPSYFGIRLAALGSRQEFVDLENWLSSNLTTNKDVFSEIMIERFPPPPLLSSTTAPYGELWAEQFELYLVAHNQMGVHYLIASISYP